MAIDTIAEARLRDFVRASRFAQLGAVVTDLDGTAVHEDRGRVTIPASVEQGLKRIHDLGRPVVINTLRFPLSVLRTFGREWYRISSAPVPLVTLNGSLMGRMVETSGGELAFEETEAFPLGAGELHDALDRIEPLIRAGERDLLVFAYPRDWRRGEIVWTPAPERTAAVAAKYVSAAQVIAVPFDELRAQLAAGSVCMLGIFVDLPEDRLMAYQHARRSSFVTAAGVDKLSGAQRMAQALGFDLAESLGAGDTEMDRFLAGVGLAVVVGGGFVPWRGLRGTLTLHDSAELGRLLFRLAELQLAGAL